MPVGSFEILGGIKVGLLLCVVEIKLRLASIGAEEEPWDAGDGVRAANHGELRLRPGHLAVVGGSEKHIRLAHSDEVDVLEFFAGPGGEFRQGPAQTVPTNQQFFSWVQEFSDIRPN